MRGGNATPTKTHTCVLSPIENNDFDGDIKEEVRIENNDCNLRNVALVRKECDTVIKNDVETVDEQSVVNELKKQ